MQNDCYIDFEMKLMIKISMEKECMSILDVWVMNSTEYILLTGFRFFRERLAAIRPPEAAAAVALVA